MKRFPCLLGFHHERVAALEHVAGVGEWHIKTMRCEHCEHEHLVGAWVDPKEVADLRAQGVPYTDQNDQPVMRITGADHVNARRSSR